LKRGVRLDEFVHGDTLFLYLNLQARAVCDLVDEIDPFSSHGITPPAEILAACGRQQLRQRPRLTGDPAAITGVMRMHLCIRQKLK
jgi:hypothetical protein